MRLLWLTNDLPPRSGGIERFVANLAIRTRPYDSIVVGPHQAGAAAFDAAQPFPVVRSPSQWVLPTARTLRLVRSVSRQHRPDVVVLGACWPLGELAMALARDPGVPVVALTHGLEAGLAGVGLGWLIQRATRGCAAVTTISDYTEVRLVPHVAAPLVARVPPGADVDVFHPGVDGKGFRARHGVPGDAPLVGCVARLVRRKGQDVLLAAWPALRRQHSDAWLVLVGSGPLEATLRRTVARLGPDSHVVLAGRVAWEELPAAYAALDIFAMPCRTRFGGTDVEGLGTAYLEAQAAGLPVVAGRSGGAPEALRDGDTGLVVDGADADAVAEALVGLLDDGVRRRAMGERARAWAVEHWSWEASARRFHRVLEAVTGGRAAEREAG
ncbi:MAG: glycosyltransferase family 4 protein [Actinomycetota bacterium]|nr:glycosyltransferase family 4 protein [Actinomycetota bacterium]